MPSTCGLAHPLFNYSGDRYCMIYDHLLAERNCSHRVGGVVHGDRMGGNWKMMENGGAMLRSMKFETKVY